MMYVCCFQASSKEHSEQGDDLESPREGASVELHQGAPQTASAEESPDPRGALAGGLPGLHRYPLLRLCLQYELSCFTSSVFRFTQRICFLNTLQNLYAPPCGAKMKLNLMKSSSG